MSALWNPASCAERIRLLEAELARRKLMGETAGERILTLKSAFADALLALEEIGHKEIADRLRTRWSDVVEAQVNE